MGFDNAESADFFWRKINRRGQEYVPFTDQDDDPRRSLVARALKGERFDTVRIYRELGYEV
jgi:hypothetical protein